MSRSTLDSLSRGMHKDVAKKLRQMVKDGWGVHMTKGKGGHVVVTHPRLPDHQEVLSVSPKDPFTSLRCLERLERRLRAAA